jgi:hypothetical protein
MKRRHQYLHALLSGTAMPWPYFSTILTRSKSDADDYNPSGIVSDDMELNVEWQLSVYTPVLII